MILLSSSHSILGKPRCCLINYTIHFLDEPNNIKDIKWILLCAKDAPVGSPLLKDINSMTFSNETLFDEDAEEQKIYGYIGFAKIAKLYAYYITPGMKGIPALQRVLLKLQEIHNGREPEIVTDPKQWLYDNFTTEVITGDQMKTFDYTIKTMVHEVITKRNNGGNSGS